jgi:ubiquinone/menaquinone biosynthesis C-methylase UbiE
MDAYPHEAATYDAWAEYYDVTDVDRRPQIAFYQSLVTSSMRALLEVACGTGTMTIALAERLRRIADPSNLRLVGLDVSTGMLHRARARDDQIEWVRGDMRRPAVAGRFDLIVCCFNGLQALLTDRDLEVTLRSVRSLLSDGGLFAFDIYQPNHSYLSQPYTDRLAKTGQDSGGRWLEVREDARYDVTTRVLTINWRLMERDGRGRQPLAQMRYGLRQYERDEIDRAIAMAGLVVLQRYGDYDRSPFTPVSKKQILICAAA